MALTWKRQSMLVENRVPRGSSKKRVARFGLASRSLFFPLPKDGGVYIPEWDRKLLK